MPPDMLTLRRVGAVMEVMLHKPPHNFFDAAMIGTLADTLAEVDADDSLRVTLLGTELRHFCAGADFSGGQRPDPAPIYTRAAALVQRRKPLVAAIPGAAIGGGLGLALTADLRAGDATTRFQANFVRLGISPGFGLTHTLPRFVGAQAARDLFLTGRTVSAAEALRLGLLDRLAGEGETALDAGRALAQEIARNAPLAVVATRALLAPDGTAFIRATEAELEHQRPLFASRDFDEGVQAATNRRAPDFTGR